MKTNLLLPILILATVTFSQSKMITKTGRIIFEASVPLFEEITACSEDASCVFNAKTGEIESLVMVKGFRFKIPMMEDHFNDHYIESRRYPKAKFKGRVINFDVKAITTEAKEFMMKGTLHLHGKSKEFLIPAKIRRTENGIEIMSSFNLNTEDFSIAIPAIIRKKVSNRVKLYTVFTVL